MEEVDPGGDVAVGHPGNPGDPGQWQAIAEHLEDEAVLVAALVAAGGRALRECRSAKAATPSRVTPGGLAGFPVELWVFVR